MDVHAITTSQRVCFAFTLLIAEIFFLSVLVDSGTLVRSNLVGSLLSHAGNFLRWSIVAAGILALFHIQTSGWRIPDQTEQVDLKATGFYLGIHLFLFFTFALVTSLLFARNNFITGPQGLGWLVLALLTVVTWGLLIFRFNKLVELIYQQRIRLLIAGCAALVILIAGQYFQQFWYVLNYFTLSATKVLLSLVYDDLLFDPSQRALGLPHFWVLVDSACSGIEGIIVALSTTSFYLYLSRSTLLFPRSLLLLPLAAIISITLNLFRIAILIIIGAEVSPRLAVEGFHSVAGWLAAVLVALLVIFLFSSWKWIQRAPEAKSHTYSSDDDDGVAILVPFIVLVGLTIFNQIFLVDLDYLYPVKISAVSILLAVYWKRYNLGWPENIPVAVIGGLIVAVTWIALMPDNAASDDTLANSFTALSQPYQILWVVFRLIGFWIVVPIVEELVFRGYLLSRLSGQSLDHRASLRFSWIAFTVSSVVFGLIHDSFVAGLAAGILFALLRYRFSLTTCIIAHSAANLFVTAWAVYTGQWSLI